MGGRSRQIPAADEAGSMIEQVLNGDLPVRLQRRAVAGGNRAGTGLDLREQDVDVRVEFALEEAVGPVELGAG